MSDKSRIEWTQATWNPVTGCSKVSQGCKHCYAEREWPRMSAPRPQPNVYTGRAFTDVQCHPERLLQPWCWVKPRLIFVNSMSDLFHESVPFEFIAHVFWIMGVTTRHTYQVLTKRPQRMLEFFKWVEDGALTFPDDRIGKNSPDVKWQPATKSRGGYDNCGPGWPYENVWLGVSVEDQATADERIPLLLKCPAAVRWISAEPLLGQVDLSRIGGDRFGYGAQNALSGAPWVYLGPDADGRAMWELGEPRHNRLDWVVAGGESGPGARPMHPEWARSLRDQCSAAGVPFFFKQWGNWAPYCTHAEMLARDYRLPDDDLHYVGITPDGLVGRDITDRAGMHWVRNLGKKAAGRLLDGIEHNGMPEVRP
ncbi:MAG TPA: phage Gp37/Gp68 family protein [Methylophilaceae bacterium]|nr:phage Gp37/Gp68 family protein [Methylophilaceae bacterium]